MSRNFREELLNNNYAIQHIYKYTYSVTKEEKTEISNSLLSEQVHSYKILKKTNEKKGIYDIYIDINHESTCSTTFYIPRFTSCDSMFFGYYENCKSNSFNANFTFHSFLKLEDAKINMGSDENLRIINVRTKLSDIQDIDFEKGIIKSKDILCSI
jgi:hypothetical protein